jgi:hypothetical protein
VDTATLVDRDIQDGQRLLHRLTERGVATRAACFIKPQDEGHSTLYIATPLVDAKGPISAYREVLDILAGIDDIRLGPSDVSLVGVAHPLVRDVQALHGRYREGFLPTDISSWGGMAVEAVYVYPPSDVIETFPGFEQIKQRFPSAELVNIDLPADLPYPHPDRSSVVKALLGKVNADEFAGRCAESLLFYGGGSDPERKISRLIFVFRPEGWNTQYDDNTKQWRPVVLAETNRPLHEPADFTPLLELKSAPAAASA